MRLRGPHRADHQEPATDKVKILGHTGDVRSARWNKEDTMVVTASSDAIARV